MTLEEFNSKYQYKTDMDKYGLAEVWEIPELVDGKYVGDCESYARSLRNYVLEFKDWGYWYCKLNGGGHCILYKNGDVIDCNVKKVISLEHYCRMYTITDLRKYSWFEVGSKILVGKVIVIWKSLLKK
jgi:predicted transglutaminase-like cysteine proteinase